MTQDSRTICFPVPGCSEPLLFERTHDGRLLRVQGGGRCYFDARDPGCTRYGAGFLSVEQTELPGGFVRRCRSFGRSWSEIFRWDLKGQLCEVDGVAIGYDAAGRIIACRGDAGDWFYGYTGAHLTVVDTPSGVRHVLRGSDGRALGYRQGSRRARYEYDARGRRLPGPALPAHWNCDAAGRLWSVLDAQGRIARTYLWDGWHCFGCIDGEPGAALGCVYSLDPTGTPIREVRRERCLRLPRDAFGEALLARESTPGLYGGAVHGGWVRLPLRRLDPLTGSFDAPDPFNGEQSDPRRAAGHTGPLPIELPAAGPYTVCRNNPVSLADHTGAISDLWWLIPSALTWSLQNTIGSLLGMWFTLEFSPLGWIVSAAAGANPFDLEWISAKNFDSFGLRADGWMSRIQPVAWTYQFLVNEEGSSFTALEDVRLFAPDAGATFRPRLYGSLLRCVPESAAGFVLRGQRKAPNNAATTDWSRCGGTAEPALPGSLVPVFPGGGLHFDTTQRGVHEQAAQLIEIEPAGLLLTGESDSFAIVTAPATGLGLRVDQNVVLSSASPSALEVARVLSVSEALGVTTLRVDSDLAALASSGVRLRGASAAAGPEPLTPIASEPSLLDVSGSSNPSAYQPSLSVLRMSRGGSVVHHAKVTGLQAQLSLDSPLTPSLGAGLRVRATSLSGNFRARLGAANGELELVTGTAPGLGAGIAVGPAASALAGIVQAVSGATVTLDRELSALGAAGDTVDWRLLSPGADLGGRSSAPEASATLRYTPTSGGTAPSSGFVWLMGAQQAIRRVSALDHDALVLDPARPDALSTPYDVERFRFSAPDQGELRRGLAQTFALSAAPPGTSTAFQIVTLSGASPTAGTTWLTGAALSGDVASLTPASPPPAGLGPSEVVLLSPSAGTPSLAVVRRVRVTLTLARPLTFATSEIEAAPLSEAAFSYHAERRAERVLCVRPRTGSTSAPTPVDMPRFVVGELVLVRFTDAGSPKERIYRVLSVAGTTLSGSTDEAGVPASATDITLTRLSIADPGTGGARCGLEGTVVSPTELQLSAWDAAAFATGDLLAIVDGSSVVGVRVAAAAQPLSIELALPEAVTGPVDIAQLSGASSAFTAEFSVDGATLTLPSAPGLAPAAGALAAVVPYIDSTRRVSGRLHPGSVRVPEDHENAALELSRRQALQDHELTHTLQSARYGPLMLTAFPLWALELATDLTAAGGPALSPYVAGNLADGVISIANPGTTRYESGNQVQVAQSGRAVFCELGPAADGGRFRLADSQQRALSAANIRNGPIQIRRALGGTGSDILEWVTNILQLLTIGGLMNVLSLLGWGGLIALIIQIVQWIRGAARNSLNASVGADGRSLSLPEGQSLEGLHEGVLVALKAGDAIFIRAVQSLSGRDLMLGERIPAPATGSVELSVYSPGDALLSGPRGYYPAQVPDANRPARLQVLAVGDDSPSFRVHDRVHIRNASGTSYRTLVTAVDGLVIEVEEPALLSDSAPNEFLVGTIGAEDPTGWLDQWLINELGVGFLQYVHDPWGQILYRTQPSDLPGQIAARSARYLFGTQSWACLFFGWFWNDNAYQRANPHRSAMEQEASRKSGDTYSPLGSFHGDVSVVGDIGRYWLTVSGGTRDGSGNRPTDFISFAAQDAPGVNLAQAPLLTVGPSHALPSAFYGLDATGTFAGIGARGWVPVSNTLERSAGVYVAFSRPPAAAANFQVGAQVAGTTIGGTALANAQDAQNAGAATISFTRSPSDVVVTLAGQPVSEAATLDVIPFQRSAFSVAPNGARVYRATASEQGTTFDVSELSLTAGAASALTDDIEISRFHHFDPSSGSFDSGLGPVHLPGDIDIAVRRFQMRIQDRLPLRATLDHTAAAITNLRPGDESFLLVPAPFAPAAITTAVTGTPSLHPQITAPSAPITGDLAEFLGDGGAVRVVVPALEPPEQTAQLSLTVRVGPSAATAVPVVCEVSVEPHFRLEPVPGGAAEVTRGGTITLRASDGTELQSATTLAGVTLTINGSEVEVDVGAGFAPSSLEVRVRDQADAGRVARRTVQVV